MVDPLTVVLLTDLLTDRVQWVAPFVLWISPFLRQIAPFLRRQFHLLENSVKGAIFARLYNIGSGGPARALPQFRAVHQPSSVG